jgi:hypothetical protein
MFFEILEKHTRRLFPMIPGVPSPVGHGLAALAVGWAVAGRAPGREAAWAQAATLVAVGVAPDLDLLWGRHSAETHSVGAAVIVASIAAWRRWPALSERQRVEGVATSARIWLAIFLAWCSHPLLDALGRDGTPPLGVMAFWPFSSDYVLFPTRIFDAISRRYWEDDFLRHNVVAIAKEILLLAPVAGAVFVWRRRSGRSEDRPLHQY